MRVPVEIKKGSEVCRRLLSTEVSVRTQPSTNRKKKKKKVLLAQF
jgi:hypothetical protein